MSNIGILGGSFDPLHNGHMALAQAAIDNCKINKIIFLPARIQPFKIGRVMAGREDRINMIKIAIEGYPEFELSRKEIDDNHISYTYNTLRKFKKIYPDDQLFFIVGTDSFLSLDKWYNGIPLLREFSFIIGDRPGYREEEKIQKLRYYKEMYGTKIILLKNEMLDISSTEIKDSIKNNIDISHLVPPNVERYIYEHRLYQGIYR